MDCKEIREMYKLMFAEYPDIVTVKDLQTMLGISRHAAYDLLGYRELVWFPFFLYCSQVFP